MARPCDLWTPSRFGNSENYRKRQLLKLIRFNSKWKEAYKCCRKYLPMVEVVVLFVFTKFDKILQCHKREFQCLIHNDTFLDETSKIMICFSGMVCTTFTPARTTKFAAETKMRNVLQNAIHQFCVHFLSWGCVPCCVHLIDLFMRLQSFCDCDNLNLSKSAGRAGEIWCDLSGAALLTAGNINWGTSMSRNATQLPRKRIPKSHPSIIENI